MQERIQRLLGDNPKEDVLRGLLRAFLDKSVDGLAGFGTLNCPDLGHEMFENFAKDNCPRDRQVQVYNYHIVTLKTY